MTSYRCTKCHETHFDLYYCPQCGVTVEAFNAELKRILDSPSHRRKDDLINTILTLPTPKTEEELFKFLALLQSKQSQKYSGDRFIRSYEAEEIANAWKVKYEEFRRVAELRPTSPNTIANLKKFDKKGENKPQGFWGKLKSLFKK